ncbi:MAG: TolC family protein [Bacteroidia bacterium]|nr:TolC family protein [Bacteroidia bacterium]MDW8302288.1 TolC family protein [Bacteroidia bacterium]
MKVLILLLIGLLSALCGAAQKMYSLEQCIQYATENNLQVKQSKNAEKLQENTFFQSKANFAPNLNANSSVARAWGRNQDPSTFQLIETQSDFVQSGLSSTIILFNGMNNHYTLERNKLNLIASRIATEKIKNNIALNVALLFIQIILDKEQIKVAEQSIQLDEVRIARAQKLYEKGVITEGEILNLQAQLATDKLNRQTLENQLKKDKLSLLQAMELPVEEDFDIVVPEISDVSLILPDLQTIYNYALQNMPEVKEQQNRLKSSQIGLKIAKASYYPILSLSGNINARATFFKPYEVTTFDFSTYQFVNKRIAPDDFFTQYNRNLGKTLGITLQVPIFNRFNVRMNVSNARLEVINQEIQLKAVQNQLIKDIQQAYIDVQNAQERYRSLEEQVKALEKAYQYAQKRFEAGAINSVDLLTTQNNWQRARSELLQAKYTLIFRSKVLDFYQGKPIRL